MTCNLSHIFTRVGIVFLKLALVGALIVMITAGSCVKPKFGSISGKVILINDTDDDSYDVVDYSGVSVALYEHAELDTTLVRINSQYPQIGIQICQETEFDHLSQAPLLTTTTDAEGKYELKSIEPGTYNIVFSKDGYGWEYVFNTGIDTIVDDTLYAETTLDSFHYEQLQLKCDHHYLISTAISVGTLDVEKNSWVRFGGNGLLTVLSDITTNDDGYSYFTSDSYQNQGSLVLNSVNVSEVNNLVFRNMLEGMKVINTTISITDSRFSKCMIGIISSSGELTMANLTFTRQDSLGYLLETDSSVYSLTSSVLVGSNIALDLRNTSNGNISHCFVRAVQCAYLDAYTETKIENCQLQASDYAIKSLRSNLVQIQNNNIEGNFGIYIRQPVITPMNAINGNNIFTQYWALENSPNFYGVYQSYFMNCENNFFYTTSAIEIDAKVFDLNDQPTWSLLNFDYTPFRNTANSTAGI